MTQEVRGHQYVPGMRREGEAEQRRVVEDDEADEEQRGRHDRVADHAQQPRVHEPQHQLPRTQAAVAAGGQRAQGEADRRREDEEHRRIHRDGHVLDHVPGERHPAEHARGATRRPDEDHPADHPPDQPQGAPAVAPTVQPDHPHDVDADGDDGEDAPEPVEPPQGQPGRSGRRRRRRVPGQLRRRGRVQPPRRGGRRRAGEGRREPHGHPHDEELGHREAQEQAPPGAAVVHPSDDPAALLPAEQPEHDQAGGLDEDEGSVCGGQVPEVADPAQPDHRADDAGHRDGDEAPQRHRRVPPDDDRQVSTQSRPEQDDGQQAPHPQRRRHEVGRDGVDRGLVVGGAGRVPGQGEREQSADSQEGRRGDSLALQGHRRHGGCRRGDERADDRHAQGLERPDVGGELAPERGVVERQACGVREPEDDADQGGDHPHDTGGDRIPARLKGQSQVLAAGHEEGPDHQQADRHGACTVLDDADERQAPAHDRTDVLEPEDDRYRSAPDRHRDDAGQQADPEGGERGTAVGRRRRGGSPARLRSARRGHRISVESLPG